MQVRQCLTITVAGAALLLICGCAPSVSSLTKMRLVQGEQSAYRQQGKLLKAFADGEKPALWRVEAMTTMTHLDRKFQHHQTAPELRRQLVRELRAEFDKPRLKDPRPTDLLQVRAWSVYSLSRLDAPAPETLAFFLRLFETQTKTSDPELAVTAAAGNGLLKQPDRIWRHADYRRRILTRAAKLKSSMFDWSGQGYVRDVWNMILLIQSRHLGLADIVELLAAERVDRDNARLLEVLQWDHAALTADAAATAAVRRENIRHLLFFSRDPDFAVRQRARAVLLIHAPRAFLIDLEQRLAATRIPADYEYEHGVQLVSKLDAAEIDDPACKKARAGVLARFSQDLERHPKDLREAAYGRLLQTDRRFLARHLLEWNEKIREEDLELNLQHLRYLWLVQDGDDGKPFRPAARKAVAAWVGKPMKAVRQVVIAYLIDTDPTLLATALAPVLRNAADEKPEALVYLVDAYLAALAGIENLELDQSSRKALQAALAAHNVEVQKRIAAFLRTREPDAFVAMQATILAQSTAKKRDPRLRQFALLGDMAWAARKQLKPNTVKTTHAALLNGLDPKDEELSLLCTRHLRQLGGAIPEKTLKTMPRAVRVLAGIGRDAPGGAQ